jgi:uncharacterized protein YdeI (YjbR/CyaY-like superfamily)
VSATSAHPTFDTREDWRAWLERSHASAKEAWVVLRKKGADGPSLRYEEAVEEALCFGWIDGRTRSVDGQHYAVRFSPRRQGSIWAESNKQRVERLVAEGRMTPAGLAKVAEAKANGEWDAAAAREDVGSIPPDLERALRKDAAVWERFQLWPASRKRQYLYWLTTAKRAETREKRIKAIVDLAGTPAHAGG